MAHRLFLSLALILSVLPSGGHALAQSQYPEKWDPAGRAAEAFTGTMTFSRSRITFASGKSLPLAPAGTTSFRTDMGTTVTANVYKVIKPEAVPPYGGNRLCDGKKIEFILVWADNLIPGAPMRQLEPFTGTRFKYASPDDCGRFAYGVTRD